MVGMATCGIAAGARPVLTAFIDELEKRNYQRTSDKTGRNCQFEPVVEVVARKSDDLCK
ncbi:MAG: hypothetical protein ACLSCV_05565 [Acutalibacteraceae bacterium]